MGTLRDLRPAIDSVKIGDLAAFRYWHVENLLNQAADLTDRCLSQRQYLRSLDERRRQLCVQAAREKADSEFQKDRLANKWYSREMDAAKASKPWIKDAANTAINAEATAREIYKASQNIQNSLLVLQNEIERHSKEVERQASGVNFDSLTADEPITRKNLTAINKAGEWWLQDVYGKIPDDPLADPSYLSEQIAGAYEGILDDFNDAYNRACVAEQGMRLLYGYQVELPRGPITGDLSLLDKTSLWIRGAIRWLTARLQLEQVFTQSYSLRRLAGASFDVGIEQLKLGNAMKCSFPLHSGDLTSHRYIRLRGLSAFSVGANSLLSAELTFPKSAVSVQLLEGIENKVKLDQTQLPPCIIGRIDPRESPRPPELAGANSLLNASPFGDNFEEDGKFQITVRSMDVFRGQKMTLEDVFLEFLLAGLPRLAK